MNNNSLYNEMRFNPNTLGVSYDIKKSRLTKDKKQTLSMSIFSLMTLQGYMSLAKDNLDTNDTKSIFNKMIENSTSKVNQYESLNNRGINL